MPGLLGRKIGMTQIYNEDGSWVPVTVVAAGPCVVITKKTKESAGYNAVQLGFEEEKKKNRNKAIAGHYLKKNFKIYRHLKELRTAKPDGYAPGDVLSVQNFASGDAIDVVGVSKGKGFQGVMKRWHFGGGHASHGCSVSHRAPGSTGQRTYPGKVIKGKKMPGRMGGTRVTMKGLSIVGIEAEQNVILIKGAIPGASGALVMIKPRTGDFESRYFAGKEKKA